MFDAHDPATWPVTLTLQQVAAIYQRSADSIRHTLTPSSRGVRFSPEPFKHQPLRWRRVDVERDVCGARGAIGPSSRSRTAGASASPARSYLPSIATTHGA